MLRTYSIEIRSKSHESLLKQSQRMEGLIESLQSLKPSLRDDMTAWRKDNLSQIAGPSRSSPPVVLTFGLSCSTEFRFMVSADVFLKTVEGLRATAVFSY